nr:hypothetical protein [Mycobacterium simiae]
MENVHVYAELEHRVRDRTAAPQQANEEIRQLAVSDAMTGLTDRRCFYLLAEQKLRGAHHNGPIGLPPAIGVVRRRRTERAQPWTNCSPGPTS